MTDGFLFGVLLGVVLTRMWILIFAYLEQPHRWACPVPDCHIGVKSSDKDLVNLVKVQHMNTFHGGQTDG